ncbi:Methionyl-tRNA formyltransferase [hydrothermal vent metagenome]|uniref:Methionyl-tRNA formyltransferase n=1 Tax=hydrothermal vent metagenome TaxID=652676 RepID=A0A3B1D7M5_9ZZZZ
MRIVFLSPDEPLHLPEFYRYIIENLSSSHDIKVIIVPPVYKNTTKLDLVLRYAKTFGVSEAAVLSSRVIYYKGMDILFRGKGNGFYSMSSVFKKYGIPYLYEDDVNSKRNLDRLKGWKTELLISISCPQIFKRELIELASKGCLNLHGSILPDYRGVMPSFWMLANNENEAGSTLFFVNEKIDAGDVLVQRKFPVHPDDTLESFIRRSKRIGAEMVVEGVGKIDRGKAETYPLDMSKGNYYGWPKREDVKRFLDNGRRFR